MVDNKAKRYRNRNPDKPKNITGEPIISLGKQYTMMKVTFPEFQIVWENNTLICTGPVQPTAWSPVYKVRIWYGPKGKKYVSKVHVLYPPLKKGPNGERIPHTYPGEELCLFLPRLKEFTQSRYICKTIVPWISLWLYYYEMWHMTGKWLGGGEHPEERRPQKFQGRAKRRKHSTMYKILSIDGGGVKGIYPAAFLAYLEESLGGQKVGEYFDLIVGTSTGGIIALCLGLGMSAKDVVQLYEELGPVVFPASNGFARFCRSIIKPKWDDKPLNNVLERYLGDKKLGDSGTRLVIPSYSHTRKQVQVFKTAHHERLKNDWRLPAIEVARATSAAPYYLPAYHTSQGLPLVDGGLWANNPVEVAVIEGLKVLDWSHDNIHVLSLGCSNAPFNLPFWAKWFPNSLSALALKIPDMFSEAQSAAAQGMAFLLLNRRDDAISRYSPVVAPGKFSMDDSDCILELKGMAYADARTAQPNLEKFFTRKATPFKPLYKFNAE